MASHHGQTVRAAWKNEVEKAIEWRGFVFSHVILKPAGAPFVAGSGNIDGTMGCALGDNVG